MFPAPDVISHVPSISPPARIAREVGTSDQLSPIWKSYAILAQSQLDQQQGTNTVTHATFVYIIDKSGHERILLDDSFDPAAVAADLRILLAE